MCDPATLAIVGVGMSAVSTGLGALQANAQAQYQAKVAEQNVAMDREAAQQEQQNTRDAALQHYRQVAQLKGQQIVGAAANGVNVDFGTAADTLSDTDMLAREDVNRIYQQGYQKTRTYDIATSNDLAKANAAREAGSAALVQGVFNVGSTVLGGASQYANLQSRNPVSLTASARSTIRSNSAIF